jgi:hypothetical protein
MHPTLIGPSGAAAGQTAGVPNRARRATCLIGAYISHTTMPNGLNVVVRDTSVSGAKLEVTDAKGNPFAASTERVPERFTLVMPMERTSVECRVAWRKGHMLGVRYLGPATQLPKRPSMQAQRRPIKKSLISQLLG